MTVTKFKQAHNKCCKCVGNTSTQTIQRNDAKQVGPVDFDLKLRAVNKAKIKYKPFAKRLHNK